MINPSVFYNYLTNNSIDFFTGVPDSLLKNICGYIQDNTPKERNIIAANEGNAIALATGYHLATGLLPLVYMQNSGIGNTINPLISLADKEVYSIPLILLIGWRGEPNLKDEPQHIKQGKTTLELLNTLEIPYIILDKEFSKAKEQLSHAIKKAEMNKQAFAIVVRKDTFDSYSSPFESNTDNNWSVLQREESIKIIIDKLSLDDIIVSTTGKTSRALFEYREFLNHGHQRDFLTVGSMGHANQIALGIALQKPKKQVICFDGDGAMIMHTGGIGIIGNLSPKNFKHILFNNASHESVGGQPTIGDSIDFCNIANGFGYKECISVANAIELEKGIKQLIESDGPFLLEVKINNGSRNNLGRPSIPPVENKNNFMKFIQK
jgi:phosphonopyruvate decarboxylase